MCRQLKTWRLTTVPIGTADFAGLVTPDLCGFRRDGQCCAVWLATENELDRDCLLVWISWPIADTHMLLRGYGLGIGPAEGLSSWWPSSRSLPAADSHKTSAYMNTVLSISAEEQITDSLLILSLYCTDYWDSCNCEICQMSTAGKHMTCLCNTVHVTSAAVYHFELFHFLPTVVVCVNFCLGTEMYAVCSTRCAYCNIVALCISFCSLDFLLLY